MNERIKELAKQSGFQYESVKDIWYLEGVNPSCDLEFKKFAELIVRECAGVAHGSDQPSQDIKYHFGVEDV